MLIKLNSIFSENNNTPTRIFSGCVCDLSYVLFKIIFKWIVLTIYVYMCVRDLLLPFHFFSSPNIQPLTIISIKHK